MADHVGHGGGRDGDDGRDGGTGGGERGWLDVWMVPMTGEP